MKIFITGGNGFVGKNLIRHLSVRHEVIAPSHGELELLDEQAVEKYLRQCGPDIVIHCANVGATRKTDSLPIIVDHNVRMFLNLARHSELYKRMIFYGSGAELDKRVPIVSAIEDFATQTLPATQYGFSKYLCSHYVRHFPKIINLRIFGIFGEHDDYENRFVSNAICRAIKNLPILIYRDQRMSFVYMEDLAKITEKFLDADTEYQFYNISDANSVLLSDIARLIKIVSGKDVPVVIENPDSAPEYTCSTERLQETFPEFKHADLKDSLKAVYSWYAEHELDIDEKKFRV